MSDEPELAEVMAYVLDGFVCVPHYTLVDHYALPGGRTIDGDRLRALGAVAMPRLLWATGARLR